MVSPIIEQVEKYMKTNQITDSYAIRNGQPENSFVEGRGYTRAEFRKAWMEMKYALPKEKSLNQATLNPRVDYNSDRNADREDFNNEY